MKKNIIGVVLITVILLVMFIKDVPKYRFFTKGLELKHKHGSNNQNVFKLDNDNIFILGQNNDNGDYIPSEIYDIKANKVKEIILPKNIHYWDNGLLLNDNKLLITHAYNPNNLKYKDGKSTRFKNP